MARSFNNARTRNDNDWTADRRSRRAMEGKQTKQTRKNRRRDIETSLRGEQQ